MKSIKVKWNLVLRKNENKKMNTNIYKMKERTLHKKLCTVLSLVNFKRKTEYILHAYKELRK